MSNEIETLKSDLNSLKAEAYDIIANLQSAQTDYKRVMDILNQKLSDTNKKIAEVDNKIRQILTEVPQDTDKKILAE